jgi:hypothetical protein
VRGSDGLNLLQSPLHRWRTADDLHSRDRKSSTREQPFAPLQIVTTTGQTYDIYHPDLVFVTVESLMVGLPSSKDPSIATGHITRVALGHVTELRDLPRHVAPNTNGPAA